jgi:hypothetical protein
MLTPAAAATSWMVVRPVFPPAIFIATSDIFDEKTFSLLVRQVGKAFPNQVFDQDGARRTRKRKKRLAIYEPLLSLHRRIPCEHH